MFLVLKDDEVDDLDEVGPQRQQSENRTDH